MLLAEPIDHTSHGILSVRHQVRADSGRGVVAGLHVMLTEPAAFDQELRGGDVRALAQLEPQAEGHGAFDARDAHFAVLHRRPAANRAAS